MPLFRVTREMIHTNDSWYQPGDVLDLDQDAADHLNRQGGDGLVEPLSTDDLTAMGKALAGLAKRGLVLRWNLTPRPHDIRLHPRSTGTGGAMSTASMTGLA